MKGLTLNLKTGSSVTIGEAKIIVKETRGRWAILVIDAPPEVKIGKVEKVNQRAIAHNQGEKVC